MRAGAPGFYAVLYNPFVRPIAHALGSSCLNSVRAYFFPTLLLALCACLSGCSSGSHGSDVMAKVNGHAISRAEVEKYYENQSAGAPQKPTGEQEESLRLNILKQLIDQEIMMQRAEKLNLVATDDEVDRKLNELKAPYTQEQFEQKMKDSHMTLDDLKRDLRRNLTIDKVLNKEITSKINITDKEITDFYNQNKAQFNLIEPRYHLAQIVVSSQPAQQVSNLKNDKAQNEAEARKKIQMIENRLESGDDFAQVAMNYSEQPDTAGNGGDMGMISESQLRTNPEIYTAVSKLKPGEISHPLPVMDPNTKKVIGYSIVRLISKEPAGQRELNDPRVQQFVREQLRDSREQLLKSAYYDVVHNESKIENYYAEELLKNVK
jgi:peptidyl-prolyl cis-trans isomerase SurA